MLESNHICKNFDFHVFVINYLIGANLIAEDHRGRQIAHFAAMRNHKKILQFLFDQGIDLDCRCEMGKTPVHYSAQYGGMHEWTYACTCVCVYIYIHLHVFMKFLIRLHMFCKYFIDIWLGNRMLMLIYLNLNL